MNKKHHVRRVWKRARPWQRKRALYVSGLVAVALVIAFVGLRSTTTTHSVEVTFTDAAPSGLQIVPASCPSNPDWQGSCDPQGNLDSADCSSINGWAFSPNDPNDSINVDVYQDGPAGTGSFVGRYSADGSRPDVDTAYGISGNHGFTIPTPDSAKDGQWHALFVYAIDPSGDADNPLIGSNPGIQCAPAPPSPPQTCQDGYPAPNNNANECTCAQGNRNACSPNASLSFTNTELSPGAGATVTPGSTIQYRMYFANAGPVPQTDMEIIAPIPQYAQESWQGGGTDTESGGVQDGELWWKDAALPAQGNLLDSGYVDYDVVVNSDAPDGSQICNIPSIWSDQVPSQGSSPSSICNTVSNPAPVMCSNGSPAPDNNPDQCAGVGGCSSSCTQGCNADDSCVGGGGTCPQYDLGTYPDCIAPTPESEPCTMSATPSTIQAGNSTTITWQAYNNGTFYYPGGFNPASANGTETETPNTTASYAFTDSISGAGCSAQVIVAPACDVGSACTSGLNICGMYNTGTYSANCTCSASTPSNSQCVAGITVTQALSVTPALVQSGEPTNVIWNIGNAASCNVTATNGDGTGKNQTGLWDTLASPAGGETSSGIEEQTVYTLYCTPLSGATNSDGTPAQHIQESATVNIVPGFHEQ